jgi:acyl-CoA synthetase (AMP-forming)/AMP-acid ligase II
MLFTSPRNNLDGHLHVLAGADCHVFLRANGTNVDSILEARRMRTAIVPELADMLEGTEPVAVYPYTKTFEEACMDPCLVLHTTGSTGLPKPIVWKNANLASYEAWRTVPAVDGYVPTTAVYQQARRAYTSMPLFHTSGLNAGITWSLLCGVTLVYGAPKVVPNAGYADEMHLHAGVDATMGAPSIYEELSRDPESRRRLDKMQYVVASGGKCTGEAMSETEEQAIDIATRSTPFSDGWPHHLEALARHLQPRFHRDVLPSTSVAVGR